MRRGLLSLGIGKNPSGVSDRGTGSEGKDRASTYSLLLDSAPFAVLSTDENGRILTWNPAAESMFGYSLADVIGLPVTLIIPERFHRAHEEGMRRMRQGEEHRLIGNTVEIIAQHATGREFPAELTLSLYQDDGRTTVGAHIQDTSDRHAREANLEHLARHDELTGLLTPRAFLNTVRECLANAGKPGLLVIDLDNFKSINDSLGHLAGDALLQSVAVRFRLNSDPNWRIARMGGDEFAILIPGPCSEEEVGIASDRILKTLEEQFLIFEHQFSLGGSIGAAVVDDDITDAETLLLHADLAMFAAKKSGKARRVFDDAMRSEHARQRILQADLVSSVEKCEWELFFQPQVDIRDCSLIGVEALLRWNHPDLGLLAPASFMNFLETHLIAQELGDWIINEACRFMAECRHAGLTLPSVACNLFPIQALSEKLSSSVPSFLDRYGLEPSDVEFEVTEQTTLKSDKENLSHLMKLYDAGHKITLDDFGTGYASLATLQTLPLTGFKIDRRFVADFLTDTPSEAIIAGMIAVAECMKIEVVAEGVETENQRARLEQMGCNKAQGHLFAKPLTKEDFIAKYR